MCDEYVTGVIVSNVSRDNGDYTVYLYDSFRVILAETKANGKLNEKPPRY